LADLSERYPSASELHVGASRIGFSVVGKLVQQFLLSTTRVPTEILDNSVVAESWPSEEKPHAAVFLHTRHASRSISMRG